MNILVYAEVTLVTTHISSTIPTAITSTTTTIVVITTVSNDHVDIDFSLI